jgi:hypothetical protein
LAEAPAQAIFLRKESDFSVLASRAKLSLRAKC